MDCFCIADCASVAPMHSYAQATTIYFYDRSNRVVQAISTTGAGVQYQYDAAGNTTAILAITPQQLSRLLLIQCLR